MVIKNKTRYKTKAQESRRAQRREREVSGGRVGGKTWNSYMSHREQSSKPVLRMEWKTFRRCWIVSYNSVVSAMEQSIQNMKVAERRVCY